MEFSHESGTMRVPKWRGFYVYCRRRFDQSPMPPRRAEPPGSFALTFGPMS